MRTPTAHVPMTRVNAAICTLTYIHEVGAPISFCAHACSWKTRTSHIDNRSFILNNAIKFASEQWQGQCRSFCSKTRQGYTCQPGNPKKPNLTIA